MRRRTSGWVQIPTFNDPAHWRKRAEEARTLADEMRDDFSRRVMRQIADDYDKLAERAEERLRRST